MKIIDSTPKTVFVEMTFDEWVKLTGRELPLNFIEGRVTFLQSLDLAQRYKNCLCRAINSTWPNVYPPEFFGFGWPDPVDTWATRILTGELDEKLCRIRNFDINGLAALKFAIEKLDKSI